MVIAIPITTNQNALRKIKSAYTVARSAILTKCVALFILKEVDPPLKRAPNHKIQRTVQNLVLDLSLDVGLTPGIVLNRDDVPNLIREQIKQR